MTNQFENGHIRSGLKEFSSYYANRLGYAGVEELVERTTGEKQLTGQSVQNIVENKALEVSKPIITEALSVLEDYNTSSLPEIKPEVDVYDAETIDMLIMVDGICVKKQAESRIFSRKAKAESKSKSSKSFVSSKVVLLEKKAGNFEYIVPAIESSGEELIAQSDIVIR